MGDLFSRLDESNRRRNQADRRCDHTLKELRNDFVSLKDHRSELIAKLKSDNGGDSSPASNGSAAVAPNLLQSTASTPTEILQKRDKSVEECIAQFSADISNFIGRQTPDLKQANSCHNFSNPLAELRSLKQLGMVSDYLNHFKTLLEKVEIKESYAVHLFVSGLHYHIQNSVRMFRPKSLVHAFALARLQESCLNFRGIDYADLEVKDGVCVEEIVNEMVMKLKGEEFSSEGGFEKVEVMEKVWLEKTEKEDSVKESILTTPVITPHSIYTPVSKNRRVMTSIEFDGEGSLGTEESVENMEGLLIEEARKERVMNLQGSSNRYDLQTIGNLGKIHTASQGRYRSEGRGMRNFEKQLAEQELISQVVAMDVTKGMCYLHQNAIIQRGLKVANFFMDEKEVLKTVNTVVFGVDHVLLQLGSLIVETEIRQSIASEVIRLKFFLPTHHKADVSSFGFTVWVLLRGKFPYSHSWAIVEEPRHRTKRILQVSKEYYSETEGCLLYSTRMFGDGINYLHIASGTILIEEGGWKVISQSGDKHAAGHAEDLLQLNGDEGFSYHRPNARIWEVQAENGTSSNAAQAQVNQSNGLILFRHSARIWNCYICESFIITVGEDCTYRVCDKHDRELNENKKHSGRGVWRCLYNSIFSFPVVVGFNSAIHRLHDAAEGLGKQLHWRVSMIGRKHLLFRYQDHRVMVCSWTAKLSSGLNLLVSVRKHRSSVWTYIQNIMSPQTDVRFGFFGGNGKVRMAIVHIVGSDWKLKIEFTADLGNRLKLQKLWKLCHHLQFASLINAGSYDVCLIAEYASCSGKGRMYLDASFDDELVVCGIFSWMGCRSEWGQLHSSITWNKEE